MERMKENKEEKQVGRGEGGREDTSQRANISPGSLPATLVTSLTKQPIGSNGYVRKREVDEKRGSRKIRP